MEISISGRDSTESYWPESRECFRQVPGIPAPSRRLHGKSHVGAAAAVACTSKATTPKKDKTYKKVKKTEKAIQAVKVKDKKDTKVKKTENAKKAVKVKNGVNVKYKKVKKTKKVKNVATAKTGVKVKMPIATALLGCPTCYYTPKGCKVCVSPSRHLRYTERDIC